MNLTERLLKAMIARGDYLDGIEREQLSTILPILESAHESLLGKIAKTKGVYTAEWLDQMAGEIQGLYESATKRAYSKTKGDLKDLAESESDWVKEQIDGFGLGISLTAPATSLINAVINSLPTSTGAKLEMLFEALADNTREAAIGAIRSGMLEGETVEQLTARLRGEVIKKASWRTVDGKRTYIPGTYRGGALEDVTTRQARILARTAVMHVSNEARELTYKANQEIIKGYQYVATLDVNTCIICGADDGSFYKIDEPRPQLPRHPGDRCLYVPVIKSWKELGLDGPELPASTRASADGQVAEMVTWKDRLAEASESGRVAMLGKTRALLYNRGVPLEKMVDGGKIVPLTKLLK